MTTVHSGASDAALLIDQVQNLIRDRFNSSVTLSRIRAIESILEAWQSTDENWKLKGDEVAIPEEVKDASIRFVQSLPLGFPQPVVSGEPDGHINFEWYRSPRRVLSVSIGPDNRLYWAALVGTESPRGSATYIERVPEIILNQIARVFEGD
jgi:hypothetical protein